ncbi:MAG: choice-of-anchor tandem repeat GloVer-containing protein [Candidatus Tumulicola sp.]
MGLTGFSHRAFVGRAIVSADSLMLSHALMLCVVTLTACNHAGLSVQPPVLIQSTALALEPNTLHVVPFYQYRGGTDGQLGKSDASSVAGATFIGDPQKALYSVTSSGGLDKCQRHVYWSGCGVAYELTPQGKHTYTETVLYYFHGPDGNSPSAALVADDSGSLYGTTVLGGKYGKGAVFKLSKAASGYNETVLHSFKGGADGAAPSASLLRGKSGVLYGTTAGADYGSCACGTAFKLVPSGSHYSMNVLHVFNGGKDGEQPTAALIADNSGNLYGTTSGGGVNGIGTVFELMPTPSGDYKERVLSAFEHGGAFPGSKLVDVNGVFYGTTSWGGSGPCAAFPFASGCGVVYKLTQLGSGYVESIVHDFKNVSGGFQPDASLVDGEDGFLYGTTAEGGYHEGPCRIERHGYDYSGGCGVVYRLRPSGANFEVLGEFGKGYSGKPAGPANSGLLRDGGRFYGTTPYGGRYNQGIAYKVAP